MSIDVKSWAKKYKELTEKDETIKAMAKYYTCSFLFDMGSVKVIIEMHDGKVKNINTNPGGLDPYDFALRASEQTWREFAKPCLLYTSPSPRDGCRSRMPSSA